MKIVAAKSILKANDQLAAENRARFDAAGVFCVNVVGSPGCGKTTLLEALLASLRGRASPRRSSRATSPARSTPSGSRPWACPWCRSTPTGPATSTPT